MSIAELKKQKQILGYTNEEISRLSGVPLGTVNKVFGGETKSPRRKTILALQSVLLPEKGMTGRSGSFSVDPERAGQKSILVPEAGMDPERGTVRYSDVTGLDRSVSYLGEVFTAYGIPQKRTYTFADYLKLPEDVRVELIDGVFYDMAAPTSTHQAIAGFIYKKFLDFVISHKGTCFPFMSPMDVLLDKDDKTCVQPDVMVICDRGLHKDGRVVGAPDLIIEVLSPSTRKKDMQLKMYKYGNAGVREYWMVDPIREVVVQYDLEHSSVPVIYGFTSSVPVLIWGGACSVDLREMMDLISFLWDTGSPDLREDTEEDAPDLG